MKKITMLKHNHCSGFSYSDKQFPKINIVGLKVKMMSFSTGKNEIGAQGAESSDTPPHQRNVVNDLSIDFEFVFSLH